MKTAILTNGNQFCTQVLRNSNKLRQSSSFVILLEFPFQLKYYKRKGEDKSLLIFIKLAFRFILNFKFVLKFLLINWNYINRIKILNSIKSDSAIKFLQNEEFDYLFLAGMSILKEPVIKSVKGAVFNCHPALVPNIRGLDVIYHSVINLIPPIISIHKVDSGIDTGELVQAHLVPNEYLLSRQYNNLCYFVSEFAAKQFAEFISDVLVNKIQVKNELIGIQYQILKYCKIVHDKDYEQFFKNLHLLSKN